MEKAARSLYYPNSVYVFLLLAGLTILGFWRTYFSVLADASGYAHVHGIAMSAWVILLIAQSAMIRTDARDNHRQLGLVSYALVPLIIVSSLVFAHERLGFRGVEAGGRVLYVQLSLLFLFAASWALAMKWRKSPVIHARYMVCTAIALVDPIVARIVIQNVWPRVARPEWLTSQHVTYSLTTLLFLALIAMNWKREWKIGVYPRMLLLFLALQIPTFFIRQVPPWGSFSQWYLSLPLS